MRHARRQGRVGGTPPAQQICSARSSAIEEEEEVDHGLRYGHRQRAHAPIANALAQQLEDGIMEAVGSLSRGQHQHGEEFPHEQRPDDVPNGVIVQRIEHLPTNGDSW